MTQQSPDVWLSDVGLCTRTVIPRTSHSETFFGMQIEKKKIYQYRHWDFSEDYFVPFAIDCCGAFGPKMIKYLLEAAQDRKATCPWDTDCLHNAETNISLAMARVRFMYLDACRRTPRQHTSTIPTTASQPEPDVDAPQS